MKDSAGHLCGYVGLDKDHPLFEKRYSERITKPTNFNERKVATVNFLHILIHETGPQDGLCEIAIYFEVHGGITFANFRENGETWFFGFDCAHAGDTREMCNEEYVKKECAELAKQLFNYKLLANSGSQKNDAL